MCTKGQVVSLKEQCRQWILSRFFEFSDLEISSVPCGLRRKILPLDRLSLVDLWRLEKRRLTEGMDVNYLWNQVVAVKGVSLYGLDFVHFYDIQPPKCKANFNHSIGGKDICFQRLWKDLENFSQRRGMLQPIHVLLFSTPSGGMKDVPPEFMLTDTQPRLYIAQMALKLVVDCGYLPSFLSYGPLMDVLQSKENVEIMKHLTSQVIGVNAPCEKMNDEWFERVLSNSMPTLKLSLHYDTLSNIHDHVLKCGARKKLDELIIRLKDEQKTTGSDELTTFTTRVLQSHSSHLRLLEITSLHPSHMGMSGRGAVTSISSASSLLWFLQQPHFSCLKLSGVISTTVGKSLIFTFLSTPCTSQQRLELSSMVPETADSSVQSLPVNNDYYLLKSLLIDSTCMAHAKMLSLNKYLLNNRAVEQFYNKHYQPACARKRSDLTSWLFKLPNLKVGTLQLYDYDTNCTNITVPSTVCIETLKVFMVFKFHNDTYSIWTYPLFVSAMQLPSLCKCIWDIRTSTALEKASEELVTENPRKGQTLVIPHAEWMRITASLTSTDKKGQRQKRLEARKLREEKEEAEKVKIDIEEAKFQANKRKEAIEKARTMVYYQTDRVKTFHGALVLAEVLREREAQLKLKQAKEERTKHISDKNVQVQEQPYKDPRIVSCLHSFCRQCLHHEIERSGSQQLFQCPICERNTSIPVGGASGLPQNLHLGFEVDVAVCTSKMVNNTTHKSHAVKETCMVAKNHQMEITRALEDAKEVVTKLTGAMGENNRMIEQVEISKQTAFLAINQAFEILQQTLEERKNTLLSELEAISLSKTTALTLQKEQFEKMVGDIGHYTDMASQILQTHTDHEIVALRGFIPTELDAALKRVQTISLTPNQHSNITVSVQTDDLKQKLSNFGDVFVFYPSPSACKWTSTSVAKVGTKYRVKVQSTTSGVEVKGEMRSKTYNGAVVYGELLITMDGQHVQNSPNDLDVRPIHDYRILCNAQQVIPCNRPRCVAIHDNGDIYVGSDDGCIYVFDQTGQLKNTIGSRGSGDGQFNSPYGVSIKGDVLYVADAGNHRVQKLTSSGKFLHTFGHYGQLNRPYSVIMVSNNKLIVSDSHYHRIKIFNENGGRLLTIDGNGSGNHSFAYPWGLALDSQGNIHVAAHGSGTIKVFTQEGVYVRMYGDPNSPIGIAIDDEGYSLVSERNSYCLSIYDPEGNKIHTVGNLEDPYGTALDPRDGSVFIADYGANTVLKCFKNECDVIYIAVKLVEHFQVVVM
eukprot:Em0004g346a